MHPYIKAALTPIVSVLVILFSCHGVHKNTAAYSGENWNDYAGDNTKSRYSTLSQVNKENVHQLKVSWTYRSGDYNPDLKTTLQCNPIIIDGVVYGTTPMLKLVALNATSGKEIWRFDPLPPEVIEEMRSKENINIVPGTNYWVNRGVKYWEKGNDKRI